MAVIDLLVFDDLHLVGLSGFHKQLYFKLGLTFWYHCQTCLRLDSIQTVAVAVVLHTRRGWACFNSYLFVTVFKSIYSYSNIFQIRYETSSYICAVNNFGG